VAVVLQPRAGDAVGKLEAQPGWTWDPFGDKWDEGFRKLADYIDQHGARVPSAYSVDGFRLWQWVNDQRKRHTKGTLEPDRERKLEQLKAWTWKGPSSS
jgi:Helicase associated domain